MNLPLRRILVGLVVLAVGLGAGAASKKAKAPVPAASGSWIAEFRRFVAQKDLEVESSYSVPTAKPGAVTMSGLLRALPAPTEWSRLRLNLAAAAVMAPPGAEQQRLQAGVWLLDYLLGDRAAVLADLPPAPEEPATPVAEALAALRAGLDPVKDPANGGLPEDELRIFEQELLALEPLVLSEVKRELGGEENFARLQGLLAAGKIMNEKMTAVYEEYEKTKDQAAAQKQMEALTREFTAEHGADRDALAPFMNSPLIARYLMSLEQDPAAPDNSIRSVPVPDLVKLVGPEQAEVLLRRALELPAKLSLSEASGAATSKLARELAQELVADLKAPSWGLANAVDQGGLFEALLRRFSAPNPKDDHYRDFQTAGGYYLVGLIQQGRTQDAVAFARRMGAGSDLHLPYEVMEALEKSGEAPALWEFLRDWLGQFPAAREWDRFNRLSAQLGRQDELKALIKTMAASGAFAGLDRLRVQEMQAEAELATDDLAVAVTRLESVVLLAPATSPAERTSQIDLTIKLLQLADLREDATGFASMQATAEALLGKNWEEAPGEALSGSIKLVTTLNRLGRLAEGYRIGRATLERVAVFKQRAAAQPPKEGEEEKMRLPEYELRNLLGEQLRAAVELSRWPEALALVQENPGWNASDVSGLLRERVASNQRPVGFYMAQVALHQPADPARARRILEAQLVATPGVDAVYEAYLGLAKKEAAPLLEKLRAADRYEERPLIWQARLELDAKKWDAAIATLQQAITIDPSDGEEGRGDRMRVYAFMALAQRGKGDLVKAKFFENVVRSIRLSETADRWFETGAYAHAIALYRQALGFFQDAYCIQSRLAVRLAAEGKVDEAAEHYRRAFELMPDSFGRVESHCFGCEHVFAGEKSQGVAEQVFTTMLAARPDKPQLHYLLGYLRKEQERPAEAAEHFRRAVELDPLYLNAWSKLAELETKLSFTPEQRDDLQLKLLALDPGRHHASPDLGHVTDLARLWRVMAEAGRVMAALPAAGPMWELKASAAQLARMNPAGVSGEFSDREKDFAAVLLEHRFVEAWQAYLISLNPLPERAEAEVAKPADEGAVIPAL